MTTNEVSISMEHFWVGKSFKGHNVDLQSIGTEKCINNDVKTQNSQAILTLISTRTNVMLYNANWHDHLSQAITKSDTGPKKWSHFFCENKKNHRSATLSATQKESNYVVYFGTHE